MTRAMVEQWLADHQAGSWRAAPMRSRPLTRLTARSRGPAHGLVRGREAIRGIYAYWYDAFPDFMLACGACRSSSRRGRRVFWTFDGTTSGSVLRRSAARQPQSR